MQKLNNKNIIIKFYYCSKCGYLDASLNKKHNIKHYLDTNYNGYMIHYHKINNDVYVVPIFSNQSILTDDGLYDLTYDDNLGWLYLGKPNDFYLMAINNMDIKIPTRQMIKEDYNYNEINVLYTMYIQWYKKYNNLL